MNDVTVTTIDGQIGVERHVGSWRILTTRVHTDPDLLDQLKFALTANRISLCAGDYDFYVAFDYPPRMSDEQMLAIATEVVNDFYADPVQFVVARNMERDKPGIPCPMVELKLNRRFKETTRRDIEQALCQLRGVAAARFYYGGNRLWIQLPNHLFDIDEVVEAAIKLIAEYGKTFDGTR